jgi:hypothetical protein
MDRLPNKPSLDHLRQQAKDLLRELRSARGGDELKLSHAQRQIANRYGFSSWTTLKQHVERMREIEQHMLNFAFTPRGRFDSASLSMELVSQGAIEHPNPAVRWRCLDLLDHHGDDTIGPTVVRALDDPIPRVRRHAVHALTCARCRVGRLAVDVLAELVRVTLNDSNEKVRLQAVDSVARLASDPRARAAVAQVAESDQSPIVRAAARRLLDDPHVGYQGSMRVQRRRYALG